MKTSIKYRKQAISAREWALYQLTQFFEVQVRVKGLKVAKTNLTLKGGSRVKPKPTKKILGT